MEKIMSILGLRVHNGRIMDKFTLILIRCLERMAGKLMNSAEDFCAEEEEGPLENRARIVENEEDEAYEKALRLLAKLRPAYKKYLLEVKASGLISNLLKRRMRLSVWVGTGNKIPFRELNVVLLKYLLKEKGYAYRRNELRWYRGDLCVGKDLFAALEHLEKVETVDRSRLTISF